MKRLKYVVLTDGSAILFGDVTNHNEVARRERVLSAGFVDISVNTDDDNFTVKCFGRSESLNMVANPQKDEMIISRMINYY